MRKNRQLSRFIWRVCDWVLLSLHFSRINVTQYQSIMCFNLNTVDKSSSVYKAFFFKASLWFFFFFSNINSSYVYAARAKLVSLKSCLLFVQNNSGLYMEILYLCIHKYVPYTYILCKSILHHTQWRKH